MIVNTYTEVEVLAKDTVLYALDNEVSPDCFFEKQSIHSIFYKVYHDLCQKNAVIGAYFALHLKNVYEIEIPV